MRKIKVCEKQFRNLMLTKDRISNHHMQIHLLTIIPSRQKMLRHNLYLQSILQQTFKIKISKYSKIVRIRNYKKE